MAAITSVTITLRGRVGSRVAQLFANGVAVPLTGDNTWVHQTTVPLGTKSITLTAYDGKGASESRTALLESVATPAALV
jgi:hypothetical protein